MVRTRVDSLKCRSSSISKLDSLSDKWRQSASRRSTSICKRLCKRMFSSLIDCSSLTNLAMFSLCSRSAFSKLAFNRLTSRLKLIMWSVKLAACSDEPGKLMKLKPPLPIGPAALVNDKPVIELFEVFLGDMGALTGWSSFSCNKRFSASNLSILFHSL